MPPLDQPPEILWIDYCESTQGALNSMLKPGGALAISTNRQLSGRGRENRRWVSRGSRPIALSFGHAVEVSINHLQLLPQVIGGNLAEVCSEYLPQGKQATFVSPNDVEIDGRKIAGVLMDTRSLGDLCVRLTVGVGLNLDGEKGMVDGRRVTSLCAEGAEVQASQKEFTAMLLDRLWPLLPTIN